MATFSHTLEELLSSKRPITLQALIDSTAEKSFAILLLLLLAIPALPLPTGGITHIFEIIAMLLALELIVGRRSVWLPKRWLNKTLPLGLQSSALPRLLKVITWVEKYSRPRFSGVQVNAAAVRIIGFIILVFTVFAFLAPPFSGLDTLPALGVVLLSLGLILEDMMLTVIGIILGSVGIGLIFLLGKLLFQVF